MRYIELNNEPSEVIPCLSVRQMLGALLQRPKQYKQYSTARRPIVIKRWVDSDGNKCLKYAPMIVPRMSIDLLDRAG